jgi:hypothetical protein
MGRNRKKCSVCSTPDGARIVNGFLEKKVFLREISEKTGFSKSSVGRHSLNCVIRAQATKLKSTRFDPKRQKIVVRWPDGAVTPNPDGQKPDDRDLVFLVVTLEERDIRNPAGLMENGKWTAGAQAQFFARVKPNAQASYRDGQHERALLENAERGFGTGPQLSDIKARVSDNGNRVPE